VSGLPGQLLRQARCFRVSRFVCTGCGGILAARGIGGRLRILQVPAAATL